MYESERKGISWFGVLRKLLILILIMILIFGFIYFISARKNASKSNDDVKVTETKTNNKQDKESTKKTTKKETKKTTKKETKKSTKKSTSKNKKEVNTLSTALTQFENGSLKYFNPNNLPVDEGESKTVKLQNIINSGTLKPLETKDGKTCDKTKSTVTITRLKNNYRLTTNLTCGSKSSKKTSYVGCYSNCLSNKLCRGENNSEYAVCKTPKKDTSSDKNSTTNTNNNQNNTTTNNSSNNTNNTNNSTSNNNNTTTNNGGNTTTTPPASATKTYYKYKRCIYIPICEQGTLNSNNECVVTKTKNYTDTGGRIYQSSTNIYYAPTMQSSCEYMWSDNPNLPGWEKTNITKER